MKNLFVSLLTGSLLVSPFGIAKDMQQPVPQCQLTQLHQTEQPAAYNLEKYRGKVVYVDFWASWCPPCVKSFPFMNQLQTEFGEQGLQIVAVNMDEDIEEAKAFLAKKNPQFEIARTAEENNCAESFAVQAMPSSYLIDREGVIRYLHLGFRGGETSKVVTKVKQLLAQNP